LQLQRQKAIYKISPAEVTILKTRMLNWANQFGILVFLDNNAYPAHVDGYECLLAAGCHVPISNSGADPLLDLQQSFDQHPDWMFGHICYEYKDLMEPDCTSVHAPIIGFPLLQFFVPVTVCHISRDMQLFTIESMEDPSMIYEAMMSTSDTVAKVISTGVSFSRIVGKDDYIATINQLREHIREGDCYEINYCTGGVAQNVDCDPLAVFNALNKLSPAPFAAFYKLHDKYMACASPERYLHKSGNKILSQPIKGTARRDKDPGKDDEIKSQLRQDKKELAENVMIVDLVRNDLARYCVTGSVKVDELFGVYTFPQVHQLISTVSGTLQPSLPFTAAIRASFPMGSMTGAPKIKVMQLIDQYEQSRRELFSGTIGYITPGGDFDFNVIIRSLFYNQTSGVLAYQSGGAITFDSDPAKEWEEMRLKAWALENIFN
jgi:para-aminobenzoate synthetase component I